ncbi:MAG: class I SAM-dependent methyltransferase [Eubacteriales bacterium]|nr:class I SAM-dependent methyltransferase [Eubacteriales bacterium]
MLIWTPDTVRFQKDAAEYGSYHQSLAAHVAAYLPPDARICDAGCGLGFLSRALAPHCAHVTAVDSEPLALDVLRKDTPENVEVFEGDVFMLSPDKHFDAMVFCFFGNMEETLLLAKKHCRGKVIVIKRSWSHHRFSLSQEPLQKYTSDETEQFLRTRGISFTRENLTLDMGQPLRSKEDAVRFFTVYNRGNEPSVISFKNIEGRLQKTDDPVFPYYLPQEKPLGIFSFDAADIQ